MATQQDINSEIEKIEEVWSNPPARAGRFGNALRSVSAKGIRGLSATIDFPWPVIALGGVNGSGKTTVLQLASAAYTRANSGQRYYTLGRWVGPAITAADEAPPIANDAEVAYQFWDDTPSVSVAYTPNRTRWGYPRRGNPERNVSFIGIADYAPRIERVDRTHQNRSRLEVRDTTRLSPLVTQSIGKILGRPYVAADVFTVSAAEAAWTDEIPRLTRDGVSYTESHMGAGEQKVVRLVHRLEEVPGRSLILLEEPELTLHPNAQAGLAWYLMNLARRKGHQIVVATHSSSLFETLPADARTLLMRAGATTSVAQRVPRLAAARELAGGALANRELILAEDVVAVGFLSEIIGRYSDDLRTNACIVAIGSNDDVRRVVQSLRLAGVRAVGVRDADIGGAADQGLFTLPGNASPEEMLLGADNLARAEAFIAGITDAYARARVQADGLEGSLRAKKIMKALPAELNRDHEFLADRLTLAFLTDPANVIESRRLVAKIRETLDAD